MHQLHDIHKRKHCLRQNSCLFRMFNRIAVLTAMTLVASCKQYRLAEQATEVFAARRALRPILPLACLPRWQVDSWPADDRLSACRAQRDLHWQAV